MVNIAPETQSCPACDTKMGCPLEFHQLELTYRATRANDPKRRAQLVASICENGQQSPVVVVEQGSAPGRYILIDGYQRVAALQKLGHDTVHAVVLQLGEVEAVCLTHRLEGAGRRSALEQGWLLAEITLRHGVSQQKLGLLMGHSTSWVSRRLALVRELPEQAQQLVRKGRLCPHGAMRHLIPLARAKRKDCEQLIERLEQSGTSISARELGRLYRGWRSAEPAERQRIIQQPLLYLRAEQATDVLSAEPPSADRLLRNDLEALCAIACRASHRLDDDMKLTDRLPLVMHDVWRKTKLACSALEQRMEERLHVGPRHTKSDLCP